MEHPETTGKRRKPVLLRRLISEVKRLRSLGILRYLGPNQGGYFFTEDEIWQLIKAQQRDEDLNDLMAGEQSQTLLNKYMAWVREFKDSRASILASISPKSSRNKPDPNEDIGASSDIFKLQKQLFGNKLSRSRSAEEISIEKIDEKIRARRFVAEKNLQKVKQLDDQILAMLG